MSNINAAIIAAHNAALKAVGQDVTLQGSDWTLPVRLLIGQRNYSVRDSGGVATEFNSHDWIVLASKLVRNSQPFEPFRGMLIVRDVGTRRHTFEVSFPDAGQPPWRWSDPQGQIYRIHSTLLKDEPLP